MSIDKRQFARANYPCSITVWHEDGAGEVIMANTANISVGGLCVYLNRSVEPGKKLEIKIDNFFEGGPLRCFGRVVRCLEDTAWKDSRQKFYEIGVEFNQIDEKQRQYLEGFVQRLLDLEAKKNV
jgi:c-di-GMP-binding flagellar brake protein YcgR